MEEKKLQEMFQCVPEIDFSSGYRYFMNNTENYIHALLAVLKSVKAKLSILQSMARTGEYEGLRTITRTLQQMFGNAGANGIADLSYQMEMSLLNREDSEVNDQLVEYIFCLDEFSGHLESLLKELDMKSIRNIKEEQIPFGKYDFTKTKESIKLSADLLERKII